MEKTYFTFQMTSALAEVCNKRCRDGETCRIICPEMLLLVDAVTGGTMIVGSKQR